MIIITGSVRGDTGTMPELLRISLDHVHRSRTEPGCISHDVHRHAEEANLLVFLERWQDMAAVTAHFSVPDSQQFVRDIQALAVSPPDIHIYESRQIPFAIGQGR